jgi:valyl-tRNA synthetase
MFTNLTNGESVHLSEWPQINKDLYDKKLEEEMVAARTIVEAGHAFRKTNSFKVRVPLAKIELMLDNDFAYLRNEIWDIVLKELNIKNISINNKTRYPKIEVNVTEEQLQQEGQLRDLIRTIQAKRKELGLKPTDKVKVTLPKEFEKDVEYIKKKIMAKEVVVGEELNITIT